MKLIKTKKDDKYGIIQIESKVIGGYLSKTGESFGVKSLNNVYMKDGTIKMLGDDDFEVVEEISDEEEVRCLDKKE